MKNHSAQLKILFDGNCPLCIRKVRFWKRRDKRMKLDFIDIRAAEFELPEEVLSFEILEKKIHAIEPDGTIICGMDVIRAAYRELGLGWLTAPTAWPLMRPLFDALYAFVAKHRLSISRLFR